MAKADAEGVRVCKICGMPGGGLDVYSMPNGRFIHRDSASCGKMLKLGIKERDERICSLESRIKELKREGEEHEAKA